MAGYGRQNGLLDRLEANRIQSFWRCDLESKSVAGGNTRQNQLYRYRGGLVLGALRVPRILIPIVKVFGDYRGRYAS